VNSPVDLLCWCQGTCDHDPARRARDGGQCTATLQGPADRALRSAPERVPSAADACEVHVCGGPLSRHGGQIDQKNGEGAPGQAPAPGRRCRRQRWQFGHHCCDTCQPARSALRFARQSSLPGIHAAGANRRLVPHRGTRGCQGRHQACGTAEGRHDG
jgi:hypothetical protein